MEGKSCSPVRRCAPLGVSARPQPRLQLAAPADDLDGLSRRVAQLGGRAGDIGRELAEQRELLDGLDEGLDGAAAHTEEESDHSDENESDQGAGMGLFGSGSSDSDSDGAASGGGGGGDGGGGRSGLLEAIKGRRGGLQQVGGAKGRKKEAVEDELNDVRSAMRKNIDSILERGERMDSLVDKVRLVKFR